VRRGKAIGWTLLLGLVAWALAGRGLVNYDTLYALVWGRDLTHGTLPTTTSRSPRRPTRWPRWPARSSPSSAPRASIDATIVLAFVFLGALAWVTYRLGEEWVNRAAGALAAAIVLTRRPVLDFGARAYVDVPYLALVSTALLVETRSRRAGAPVLALLGVAGLIRPEAWLFSGAYLIWLWVGGVRDPRLWALAAAAPAVVGARRPRRHGRPPALADRHARQPRSACSASPASTRSRAPCRAGSARSSGSPSSSARRAEGCWRSRS
jgi:hypothetical protein